MIAVAINNNCNNHCFDHIFTRYSLGRFTSQAKNIKIIAIVEKINCSSSITNYLQMFFYVSEYTENKTTYGLVLLNFLFLKYS